MKYKMKNICCSGVPIPRFALSVKRMPLFSSKSSFFYFPQSKKRYYVQSKARSTLQNFQQSAMPPLWGAR
eukprot:197828-Pelagomonas_calceolata.AAC.1